MDDLQRQLMGSRIREERLKAGMSQDMLAEKLGMKRANISNYEAGRVVPPGNILLAMADIFNVSSDYLLGRADKFEAISNTTDSEFDEEVRVLAREMQHLDQGDKEALFRIVKSMRKRGKEALDE